MAARSPQLRTGVRVAIHRVGLTALVLAAMAAATSSAQAQPPASPAAPGAGALKVFLTCESCDRTALQTSLPFIELVGEASSAAVGVAVTSSDTTSGAGAGRRWSIVVTDRGATPRPPRTIAYLVAATATADDARADLVRFLKLGLAEYALETPLGSRLDVSFAREATAEGASPLKADQKDRWNYWVYRVGAEGYGDGEQSANSSSYYVNASANRTTENWKLRIGASRSLNRNSFTIEEGVTIESRLGDWSMDTLIVKSLTPHWSFGFTGGVTGSTFSNSSLVTRLTPGIEFDIFPYRESTRRSLTIQYTAGGAYYDYEAETIFDKLTETIALHTVNVSLGLRQPWGQAGSSFVFSQHLSAPERTRVTFNGNVSVRLVKSLTLNASGSYARIRDLFTLEKGAASDEEVLLRQRQLATGFRYSFGFGFGYSFGALSNATVNPRFGG